MGFEPEDFEDDEYEVWPENWPAFNLFCRLQTQWHYASGGMGATATGLNYLVLLALMDRMNLDADEHDQLFSDVQTLERTALVEMNK